MARYDEITVKLSGRDGNAFVVMGAVSAALKRGGVSEKEVEQFMSEAMGGDYHNLLRVCMDWVKVV